MRVYVKIGEHVSKDDYDYICDLPSNCKYGSADLHLGILCNSWCIKYVYERRACELSQAYNGAVTVKDQTVFWCVVFMSNFLRYKGKWLCVYAARGGYFIQCKRSCLPFLVTPMIIDWDKSHCTYMYTSSLKSNEKSTLSQFIGPILGWQNRCNLSWFLFAHNYPSDYYWWFLPLAGLSPGQLDDNPIKGIIIDVQTYSSNISVNAWHITLSVHHFHFITQCWHIRQEFNILKRWYWNKYRIHFLLIFCWP